MSAQQQLALYDQVSAPVRPARPLARLCVGCRAREARYGFSEGARRHRPGTLCFGCFQAEVERRQRLVTRAPHGWHPTTVALPLTVALEDATRRRRRAQIAARHALGL